MFGFPSLFACYIMLQAQVLGWFGGRLFLVLFISDSNSVIFVNENENQNGEKRENNEFVTES